MAGQHHGLEIERLQKAIQVLAQVEPGIASFRSGGSAGATVAAKVKRQDAQIAGQGGEDRPVGARVEAIGVQKDRIDRSFARAEVEIGEIAGSGLCLEPKRVGSGLVSDNVVHAASL